MPSVLMVAPQRSMSNSPDMRGSPLKEAESLRGTMYLRVDLPARRRGKSAMSAAAQSEHCARSGLGPKSEINLFAEGKYGYQSFSMPIFVGVSRAANSLAAAAQRRSAG
jgi:hypothetical protein